jgi:hypothetical protein
MAFALKDWRKPYKELMIHFGVQTNPRGLTLV